MPWSTTDLYMQWAAPERLAGIDAVMCATCGTRTDREKQVRVVTAPNVRIVQPRRHVVRGGALHLSRHVVVPEREINWSGIGAFELAAVVYHRGRTVRSGHYWSAMRHADGLWYKLDDHKISYFGSDPELTDGRYVHLMVYTRVGGRVEFLDMLPGSGQSVFEHQHDHLCQDEA